MKTPDEIHAEVGWNLFHHSVDESTHRAFTVSDIAKIIDEAKAEATEREDKCDQLISVLFVSQLAKELDVTSENYKVCHEALGKYVLDCGVLLKQRDQWKSCAERLAQYGDELNEEHADFLHLLAGHAPNCDCSRCESWLEYKNALAEFNKLKEETK
jgi:hypothetical protein